MTYAGNSNSHANAFRSYRRILLSSFSLLTINGDAQCFVSWL